MPSATIEYMNARKAHKPAGGGTNYAVESDAERKRRIVDERARDREADVTEIARNILGEFSLWAELTRQQLVAKYNIPQVEQSFEEIPF